MGRATHEERSRLGHIRLGDYHVCARRSDAGACLAIGIVRALMGTTSPALAAEFLRCLDAAGVELAVLHGEREMSAGGIDSDVDVVTAVPLPELLRGAVGAELRERGIYPILVWPYDVGGTSTVFLATADMSEAVQVDALHDPLGAGKFGVRSTVLLNESRRGVTWNRTEALYAELYLLRKRHWKRQHERLAELVNRVGQHSTDELAAALTALFEPKTRRYVAKLIEGVHPGRIPRETAAYRARNVQRVVRRLAHPIGAWVSISGRVADEAASELAGRLGAFLPLVGVGAVSVPLSRPVWWVRRVVPVRWRPGIFVSAGEVNGWPQPDIQLVADDDSFDGHIALVVQELALRAMGSQL